MERDEWEDQILKQMVEMFKQMGLDVSEEDLTRMMNQIQSQFEEMGIDPEKIQSGDVKVNLQGWWTRFLSWHGTSCQEGGELQSQRGL